RAEPGRRGVAPLGSRRSDDAGRERHDRSDGLVRLHTVALDAARRAGLEVVCWCEVGGVVLQVRPQGDGFLVVDRVGSVVAAQPADAGRGEYPAVPLPDGSGVGAGGHVSVTPGTYS